MFIGRPRSECMNVSAAASAYNDNHEGWDSSAPKIVRNVDIPKNCNMAKVLLERSLAHLGFVNYADNEITKVEMTKLTEYLWYVF